MKASRIPNFESLVNRPAESPKHSQLIVYSQYLQKHQMNKYPRNAVPAWTWDEVIRLLQNRHKSAPQVAVYPYSCIQHEEIDLDEG